MAYTAAETRFLIDHAAEVADAAAQLKLTKATAIADATALRARFGEFGRAAVEQATVWRAHPDKAPPRRWIADHDAAQQATSPMIAELRAARLARVYPGGALVHDVTCSVGTEGRAVLAAGFDYLGSDLDSSRLLAARHNVAGGRFAVADALHPVCPSAEVIVADPARRAQGRRISDPAQLLPPLPALVAAYAGRELAIKCAPGLDFSDWDGLVSVASVDGGVKEACLYSPGLAEGRRREALIIRGGQLDVLDDTLPSGVGAGEIGRYIFDPDGAVVRAGLVRHLAAREGLWLLDERIAYLTGDHIPAGWSGFAFIEAVPLKGLKAALARHGAGALEILVRGVDVDPDVLRKKLRTKGTRPMTVVCTRIGRSGVALVCGARERGSAAGKID